MELCVNAVEGLSELVKIITSPTELQVTGYSRVNIPRAHLVASNDFRLVRAVWHTL